MKRKLSALLSLATAAAMLSACSSSTASTTTAAATTKAAESSAAEQTTQQEASSTAAATTEEATTAGTTAATGGVSLTVVTSFGGDDGNRQNYEDAYTAWEAATGNTVKDASATSNEQWKAQVLSDFETGSEPDVLFFFNGVDSNPLVEGEEVVSIDEIREVYPDYASNMDDSKLGASPVDGKNYSIPTAGYWEAMYVNKTVLEDAGVEIPDADTTWDEFLTMCQTIKDKGYTPIAVSLAEVPHYWFEYTVLNNGSRAVHEIVPTDSSSEEYTNWVNGLNDIKDLYSKGFLPENTLTATDAETFQLMADNKAAFAIDGSWKMGWFFGSTDEDGNEVAGNVDDVSRYTVTYVPAKGDRKTTDMIGGLSMGYYITRKAWEDPEKQAAAVSFVEAMTTDDVVGKMAGGTAVTALKNGTPAAENPNSLVLDALAMIKGSTGTVSAVQDNLSSEQKTKLLVDDVKLVANGSITAEQAVDDTLALAK
ncbi:ABC transporter substrate-binding protein [Oscillospiraceae bacterium HV4-5-C5C]|nr:ABC transporter substrate-binding protein [Oscillospiraceae bacterium HV4-5-C5C]